MATALSSALLLVASSCSAATDEGAAGSSDAVETTGTTATSELVLPDSASSGCSANVDAPMDLVGPQTFVFGGDERRYLISLPVDIGESVALPLVLDLPGFGSTPEGQDASSQMASKGTERGYIVVTPEASPATVGGGTGPMWNIVGAFSDTPPDPTAEVDLSQSDDVSFLNALVDHLEETLCVDVQREYIAGMSVGAGMTTWMICQDHSRFAAAAPVAGMTQGLSCPAATLPPFITFHGDADGLVDYMGGKLYGFDLGIPAIEDRAADFAERQGCTADRTDSLIGDDVVHMVWTCPAGAGAELYRILGGGHDWPGSAGTTQTIDATSLILDFFDEHPRGP